MPITSKGKGYLIPDDPEPEGYYCVRFYVPKDSLYLGVFWQSLHFLASPRAWADDSAHTALVAAGVWRDAIQKSQDEDACAEGDCGVNDVRQKPDAPCILQKKDCCDGSWADFADITLCTEAVPPGTQETSIDQTLDALWATKETIEAIHYLLINNNPSQIKYILGYMGIAGMNATIDAMASETEEDRQDAIDDMDWQVPFDAIWCDRTECLLGNYTHPFTQNWTACFLRNFENWCAGAAGYVADWAALLINDIVPKSFMDMVNMFPGGGENFGYSEPVCHWSHLFTWDTSQEGWDNITQPGTPSECGVFSAPDGWVSEYYEYPGGWAWVTAIFIDIATTTITKFHVKINEPNTHTFMNHYYYRKTGGAWSMLAGQVHTQGTNEYEWTGSTSCEGLRIDVASADSGSSPGSWNPSVMMDITIEGDGDNPFL